MTTKRIILGLFLTALAGSIYAAEETTTYEYDANGRLVSAYHTRGVTNTAVVFSYDPAGNRLSRTTYAPAVTSDLDGSGLNDQFELKYFDAMGQDPSSDPDGDGLVNSSEQGASGDPTLADTDRDLQDDGDEFVAGTRLDDPTSTFKMANLELLPNDQPRMWWQVVPGRSYQLQSRSQLETGDWINLGAPYVATANDVVYVEPPVNPHAFYRVLVWVTP